MEEMLEKDVVELMLSSRTAKEWNDNCSIVKEAHAGRYPSFWYAAVILAGVPEKCGIDSRIHIG